MSSARDEESLAGIKAETEDRYGRLPVPVERLFEYARLRRLAEQIGVISIDKTADGMAVKLGEKANVAPERLGIFLNWRQGASFSPSGVLRVVLAEEEQEQALEMVRDVLLEIRVTD